MALRMKNSNVFGRSLKNLTFMEGVHKKPIWRGDCLKKEGGGAFTVFIFKGKLGKKEGRGG